MIATTTLSLVFQIWRLHTTQLFLHECYLQQRHLVTTTSQFPDSRLLFLALLWQWLYPFALDSSGVSEQNKTVCMASNRLNVKAQSKTCSRHFNFFYFSEKMSWHFFCLAEDSHEISISLPWKIKSKSKLSSAAVEIGALRVNETGEIW